jgi:hypothetical protein
LYEKNGRWGKNQDPIAADVWDSDVSDGSTEILNSDPYLVRLSIHLPNNMASTELLEGVLEGSQVPHQPLLIITETVTQFGLPLFTEVLKRSEQALVPFPGSSKSDWTVVGRQSW